MGNHSSGGRWDPALGASDLTTTANVLRVFKTALTKTRPLYQLLSTGTKKNVFVQKSEQMC